VPKGRSIELFHLLPWRGPTIDDRGQRVSEGKPLLQLAFLGRDVAPTWYRPPPAASDSTIALLRIVFLAWRDLANPHAGGSEFVVDRLAAGLTARHHEVTLLAGGPIGTHAYEVVDTGGWLSQYLRVPLAYLRRFRSADIIVDVENGIPFFAPLWRRRPVVCLVHHVHTEQWDLYFPWLVARFGSFLEHRVMSRLYRRCAFVAVSPSTADALARIGVDTERIHTITMGCDPEERHSAAAREPTFLYLGRLVPHKRIDLLLQLWEQVRPHTGGHLVIAGDGPERSALERSAGRDVVFHGFVAEQQKRALLDQAWLLIHPALHEGWGTVIMEAAVHGVPTIGFDVPGVRDSVQHGRSGVLAETPSQFIEAWIDLASNPVARDELATGALTWSREHTWGQAIEKFESVLISACPRTSPR
jgi:glycosyltransferase involved in cell wall biosynthesis